MKRYKIKRKQADGSFVELSLDTSIDSVYRVKDGNIKTLTDILTEEYAPKDNPVFTGSISLGRKAGTTTGTSSFAVGNNVTASSRCTHAEGYETTASGDYSHAEGYSTTASGPYSHTEGDDTTASGFASHAEGTGNIASGDRSHAEGGSTTASGNYSHAEGYSTTASGTDSHAEGYGTIAQGQNQHVQGKYNIEDTANKYAHIVGNGTGDTARSNAHVLDWNGNAWYAGQVEGTNLPYTIEKKEILRIPKSAITSVNFSKTYPIFDYSENNRYVIEYNNEVHELYENPDNLTSPNGSVIINTLRCMLNSGSEIYFRRGSSESGRDNSKVLVDIKELPVTDLVLYEYNVNIIDEKYIPKHFKVLSNISMCREGGTEIGKYSVALGYEVEASGKFSFATGYKTIATNENSFAEGYHTKASGDNSHAEGYANKVTGRSSHAEGSFNEVSGAISHAEGSSNTVTGDYSHAEGDNNKVTGDYSHAEGWYNEVAGDYSHVQGKYNVKDTENKYAHIVGNGTSYTARANAHTLDWNGNAWYAGKLTVGAAPTDDMDVVTKKYMIDNTVNASYVDTKVASLVDSAPETLDTLKELSTALGDDPNFATTVTNNIGTKLNKPATEGTAGQVLSKAADGSNVWVDNGINEDDLNTMLTNTFGFVSGGDV